MPFWIVAVLSAAGVLGIVWVLYLLALSAEATAEAHRFLAWRMT